jgi:predicted RNA binding protein YcfA (HicA-like mRNA interferase family)
LRILIFGKKSLIEERVYKREATLRIEGLFHMAVVLPSTPALMHIHHHPEKKLRQQQRAEQKMRKESEKYKRHLQKPEVRAAIEESALKREAGKTKPVLSSRIPLDVFIKNRGPLPHSEINPFTNVNCTTAKSNLEKMGFKLESGVGSHFAVRTKAASGHSHGHRLGTLPVHEGETIPPGTHRAIWKEMNDNLIAFLNQAEKSRLKSGWHSGILWHRN